jgi:hypothetical protein
VGSNPAEAVRAKKVLSTPSFGGEVKPSIPCRSFTACKRSLNVTWKSTFRQIYRTFFAHSSNLSLLGSLASYGRGGNWRRKWGRLKSRGVGQSSHNKSIGCGASEGYAPGPEEEEEEEEAFYPWFRAS